jgi:NHLM bacteriocin system ABC transporter ATP-binding protein
MSVPDQDSLGQVKLDLPTLTLAPDGTAVMVTAGSADVFAVDSLGVRFAVAVISAGNYAFAAGSPLSLVVVPRLGAVLSDQGPQDTELADAVSVFVDAASSELGEEAATGLQGVAAQALPAALTQAISAAMSAEQVRRETNFQASLVLSRSTFDESLSRMAYSGQSLRNPVASVDNMPLVAVLTILGAVDGFTVTAPTPEALRTTKDPLRLIAHASGVRYRPVTLPTNWVNDSTANYFTALLTPGSRPQPIALIKASRGYVYQGAEDPAPIPLTPAIVERLVPQAFEFYSPLTPDRPAKIRDVITVGMRGSGRLWLMACLMALGVALLGLFTPTLTNLVVGTLIPQGNSRLLIQVGLALVVAACVAFVFSLVQNFTVSFISQRATLTMQSAFWDRVLSLPASFFRNYSSGDLTVRVLAVDSLQSLVSVQVVSAALAAIFGLVNLVLMFSYDVMLGVAGLLFILLTCGVLFLGVKSLTRFATISLTETKRANGWLVQMLSGIMKIRIANAEDRMEAQYFDITRRQTVALSQQTLVVGRISAWFIFAASGASALFYLVVLMQWEGGSSAISSAEYLAFTSAYGLAFSAIAGLSGLISPIANAGPTFNLLSPIMEELPETAGGRQDPGTLTGLIELRDVYFRYTPDGPMILRGLNLKVEPGKMLALVGPSGAGKSTITRQLLGFDTPERGQVLFDGRDLRDLDPTLVRGQMGVVVQEGRITRGSILKNILGGVVQDEALAWNAAKRAALADEIDAMPMKMQTIVDPTNVSGGQAQRILLARALVRNPAIIILDEATSALDNASQATVTQAMVDLKATRIVIAHRLSTIMSADMIVVMDKGQAVESGTFDELMALNGVFRSLVERQTA